MFELKIPGPVCLEAFHKLVALEPDFFYLILEKFHTKSRIGGRNQNKNKMTYFGSILEKCHQYKKCFFVLFFYVLMMTMNLIFWYFQEEWLTPGKGICMNAVTVR